MLTAGGVSHIIGVVAGNAGGSSCGTAHSAAIAGRIAGACAALYDSFLREQHAESLHTCVEAAIRR